MFIIGFQVKECDNILDVIHGGFQVDKASSDLRHTNVRLKETLTNVIFIPTEHIMFLDLKGRYFTYQKHNFAAGEVHEEFLYRYNPNRHSSGNCSLSIQVSPKF